MNNLHKLSAVAAVVVLLNGCSGRVYTVPNPKLEDNKPVEGLITYQPVTVIELYKYTLLIDDNGNIIGREGSCAIKKFTKFSTRPDYTKPYLVKYEPGLIDRYTFKMDMNNGVLSSINSESNPTAGLADIAHVLPFFKAPAKAKAVAGARTGEPKLMPECNSGEKLIGIYFSPGAQPYEDLKKELGQTGSGGGGNDNGATMNKNNNK